MQNVEQAAKELGGLKLPPDLEPFAIAGRGGQSIVFKASFRGETVAMKAYRPEAVSAYKEKYGVNIAVYEMSQNRKFRKTPELLPFTAKPLSVIGHDGRFSLIFLQEYLDAIPMSQLAGESGGLPDSVLESGEQIVRFAGLNEMYDLGLEFERMLVRKVRGVWQPVLHDFNGMPEYKYPPNAVIKMAYRTGARKPAHRDYRNLADWRSHSAA